MTTPESTRPEVLVDPSTPVTQSDLKRQAREAKAVEKANRNWFGRHKIFTAIGSFAVAMMAIVGISSGSNDNKVEVAAAVVAADTAATTAPETTAPKSDTKVGTSRDNPAPLGSAITDGDWTVTVNSVTPASADKYGQGAADGSTLLVANMSATYNGDDPQGSSPWANLKFVTAEGNTIDSLDGSTMFIPDDQFDSLTTVYGGATVTGNQIIEVPADAWQNGTLVVSPALLSDDTFVAVQ